MQVQTGNQAYDEAFEKYRDEFKRFSAVHAAYAAFAIGETEYLAALATFRAAHNALDLEEEKMLKGRI